MDKFEYLERSYHMYSSSRFSESDKLGKEGWELILCFMQSVNIVNYIFKRKI